MLRIDGGDAVGFVREQGCGEGDVLALGGEFVGELRDVRARGGETGLHGGQRVGAEREEVGVLLDAGFERAQQGRVLLDDANAGGEESGFRRVLYQRWRLDSGENGIRQDYAIGSDLGASLKS